MSEYFEILKHFDPVTLIALFLGYIGLSHKITAMENRINVTATKTDLNELDKRLCRIEGALSAKECCLLKEGDKVKKAE